jgi:hypothetical protein
VLLFAAPALAGVTVSAVQVGDTNVVEIRYEMDGGDANLPRAFALDITVDGTNTVISAPYDIHSEFYVYPGSIVISGGQVSNFGTPVAASDSNSMTIEMGSLYASNDPCHTTPPLDNGVILKFTVESDDAQVEVCITGNAVRGKVVMEDPDTTYNDPGYVTYVCGLVDLDTVCPCWGDIAGATALPPGDLTTVDFGDLTYLIAELSVNGWSISLAARPDMECADIAGATALPPGDGTTVDFGDLTYLISELSVNGWSMGCM